MRKIPPKPSQGISIPELKAKSQVAHASDYITVKEAAALLKLSEISIRRFLTQKKLKRFKVGSRTLLLHNDVMGLVRSE